MKENPSTSPEEQNSAMMLLSACDGCKKLVKVEYFNESFEKNRIVFLGREGTESIHPLKISAYRLAKELVIPETRISEIIRGRRAITADTAIRLSRFFGTSAEFWLNLQNSYDLEETKRKKAEEYDHIQKYVDDSCNIRTRFL